jgi:hypothetical protein
MKRPSLISIVGALAVLFAIAGLVAVLLQSGGNNSDSKFKSAIDKTRSVKMMETKMVGCPADKMGVPTGKDCLVNTYLTDASVGKYWELSVIANPSGNSKSRVSLDDNGQLYKMSGKKKCLEPAKGQSADINIKQLLNNLRKVPVSSESGPVRGKYIVRFQGKQLPPMTYSLYADGALKTVSTFAASEKLVSTLTFKPLAASPRGGAAKLLCK